MRDDKEVGKAEAMCRRRKVVYEAELAVPEPGRWGMLEGMTNDNVSNQYGENAWRGEVKLGEDKLGSKNMMSLI